MPNPRTKLHREFFAIPRGDSGQWTPVAADAGGIEAMVLADNFDPSSRTGSRTVLSRWQPGTLLARPVIHDFHEEVFIVEGEFMVGCDSAGQGGERFGPYSYACRPPQVWHGPFASPAGCVLLELQSYD